MQIQQTVLLLGGTGRTGRRVLEQLSSRGINVRAVVRSAQKLTAGAADRSKLTIVETDLLSMSDGDLLRQIQGCDAVISCLGHVLNLKGIFGPPHNLVTRVVKRICGEIVSLRPEKPVKYILMSSVSVNHTADAEKRRGKFDKTFMWIMRNLMPPAKDNQLAADFLWRNIGVENPFVQWVAVRPDTLLEGGVSEYAVHENLVSSLMKPDQTNMANVARFMCELVENQTTWNDWKGKLPVIINAVNPKK